jgi:hypothetical protein
MVGVNAAGSERRIAPDKEPDVAVADDAHQEGLEPVHIADAGVALTVQAPAGEAHELVQGCGHLTILGQTRHLATVACRLMRSS